MADPVFSVKNLDVRFSTPDGEVHAVKNANFDIMPGDCLGVVGESGSGKSQMFLAAIGLLAGNGKVTGSVAYRGIELVGAPLARLNAIRGSKITMIFQDPLTSLTPHMRIGEQIMEALRVHERLSPAQQRARALEMLERAARRYMASRSEDNHAQLTEALEVAQEAIKAREAWI